MNEPKVGEVVDGMLVTKSGSMACGCHHHPNKTTACGGCYARLALTIDKAFNFLVTGDESAARDALSDSITQRLADKAKR